MPPTSSIFLHAESPKRPMHVGGLALLSPPEGATALELRDSFRAHVAPADVAPVFRKRAHRGVTTLGQWAWELDRSFDLEDHVLADALPQPGHIRELLALCSRLHASPLDRRRALWEAHVIEGLSDGRLAMYLKVHHAVADGAHALGLLAQAMSEDPTERGMPAPWAVREPVSDRTGGAPPDGDRGDPLRWAQEVAGIVPALAQTVWRALDDQSAALSLRAPRTILNVPITGARRFAAQSWPIERIREVGQRAGVTVNDVVLAMCSGALRSYLLAMDALPDAPLVAMVPVALPAAPGGDGGGNALGLVMCNLGSDQPDPALRLHTVLRSMTEGKQVLRSMSRPQIIAVSALGIAPAGLYALLGVSGLVRPPFNLVISNLPGSAAPLYWNGARLDGLYPLSIPMDGLALNITCTSYYDQLAFGLTGCRRTVPHLQRLLGYLEDELVALEHVAGMAAGC